WRGVTDSEHKANCDRVLGLKPHIVIDDGAELSIAAHLKGKRLVENIIGACEETTTGVTRLRAMEKDGRLNFPVIAVNDALTKFLFDSRYGTGQSALEGVMRATNLLLAANSVVFDGFGCVGL